jgi:hypothetical protein
MPLIRHWKITGSYHSQQTWISWSSTTVVGRYLQTQTWSWRYERTFTASVPFLSCNLLPRSRMAPVFYVSPMLNRGNSSRTTTYLRCNFRICDTVLVFYILVSLSFCPTWSNASSWENHQLMHININLSIGSFATFFILYQCHIKFQLFNSVTVLFATINLLLVLAILF